MGCLLAAVAAVLSLAIPASIARSSLVGAYLVIAALTALAWASLRWYAGRQGRRVVLRRSIVAVRVGVGALVYAVVVTAVHFV